MDRQIVNPDPGVSAAILTGYPHFEIEKKCRNVYFAAVQIVAGLRIVMLDDMVFAFKIQF